eukprot:1954541-Rhodomonas_salina.1
MHCDTMYGAGLGCAMCAISLRALYAVRGSEGAYGGTGGGEGVELYCERAAQYGAMLPVW